MDPGPDSSFVWDCQWILLPAPGSPCYDQTLWDHALPGMTLPALETPLTHGAPGLV